MRLPIASGIKPAGRLDGSTVGMMEGWHSYHRKLLIHDSSQLIEASSSYPIPLTSMRRLGCEATGLNAKPFAAEVVATTTKKEGIQSV